MLTTITPFWGRHQMLRVWLAAIEWASVPGMKHLVYFVGEPVPDWAQMKYGMDPRFHFEQCLEDRPGQFSIGHYHNLGARHACSEWIMKMDVDTLPNLQYFRQLLPILKTAGPKEWFNGGMMYVNESISNTWLTADHMPLKEEVYRSIMQNRHLYCGKFNTGPSATNFICRREVYLSFGGCDERFQGYGWEDYQQIYALERVEKGKDPLPGLLNLGNVTRRCCAEISRLKAKALWERNPWLCLLHRDHPASSDPAYKSTAIMGRNRQLLLDYILSMRRQSV